MKKASLASAALIGGVALAAGALAAACGSSSSGTGTTPPLTNGGDASSGNGDGGSGILPTGGDDGGSSTTSCTGLQCQIHSCSGGGSTTISGTVYDPAGNNPLYNVVVYVPNSTPSALTTGASCDSCASLYSGDPIAAAVTDATGKFTIKDAPDGANIPLVIQIGKWRKQTSVASVSSCTDNPIATKLTLPSKQSEGDIPNIAISTGGADSLECLLRRIGLDASEYGPGAGGSGRIHIFQGSAAGGSTNAATTSPTPAPGSAAALWDSVADLMPYDITILSCEGQETQDANGSALSAAEQQNLLQYTSAGGRVFASHFHYAWFNTGPFAAEDIATWTRGANPINDSSNNPLNPLTTGDFINANIVTTFADGGVFPKGATLDTWLSTVGALNPAAGYAPGELHIAGAKHNADLAGLASTPSQAWISADSERPDRGRGRPPAVRTVARRRASRGRPSTSPSTPRSTRGSTTPGSRHTAGGWSTATSTSARRPVTTTGRVRGASSPQAAQAIRSLHRKRRSSSCSSTSHPASRPTPARASNPRRSRSSERRARARYAPPEAGTRRRGLTGREVFTTPLAAERN